MRSSRTAGITLPIESLPGRYGIGDLGSVAHEFVDFLEAAGQSWWHIPSIGPTSALSKSSHALSIDAGNPYILCLDRLSKETSLRGFDAVSTPDRQTKNVDATRVTFLFDLAFKEVFRSFDEQQGENKDFVQYCEQERDWLEDFAHFQALRRYYRRQPWWTWPLDIAKRTPRALSDSQKYLKHEITREKFLQFNFDRQWRALRCYAHDRGIGLIGELPLISMNDTVEVWAQPSFFELNSATLLGSNLQSSQENVGGQLSGSKVVQHRWDVHRSNGFSWWVGVIGHAWERFDVLRLGDVFLFPENTGLDMPSARTLTDVACDGDLSALFRALVDNLGKLKAIKGDQGVAISGDLNGHRLLEDSWAGDGDIALASMPHILRHFGNDATENSDEGSYVQYWRIDVAAFNKTTSQQLAQLTSLTHRTSR